MTFLIRKCNNTQYLNCKSIENKYIVYFFNKKEED